MKDLINRIEKKFPLKDVIYQRDDFTYATGEQSQVIELLTYLRDIEGFTHLVLLTAVDWIEDELFQLTYMLNNRKEKCDLSLRIMVDRNNPVMTSAHHLWAAMATYQRELYEMFGISFPGSPRMKEPFILEGWHEIPPYRRDFDTLKYSEETYFPRPGRSSKDPAEHMKYSQTKD